MRILLKFLPVASFWASLTATVWGRGGDLGLHFGSKNTGKISIIFEDIEKLSFFFLKRSEVQGSIIFCMALYTRGDNVLSYFEFTIQLFSSLPEEAQTAIVDAVTRLDDSYVWGGGGKQKTIWNLL